VGERSEVGYADDPRLRNGGVSDVTAFLDHLPIGRKIVSRVQRVELTEQPIRASLRYIGDNVHT